VELVE
jgi:hypothetical protein